MHFNNSVKNTHFLTLYIYNSQNLIQETMKNTWNIVLERQGTSLMLLKQNQIDPLYLPI